MHFGITYNEETKVWQSMKTAPLFDRGCSIGCAALHMLRSMPPEAVCQISDSEGTTLTYGTFCSYAVRVAQHFREMQLTADDVVGIVAFNTTLLAPIVAACWFNGTPFHTINPIHEEHVIRELFNITKPKVVFSDGAYYSKVKHAISALNVHVYTLCSHVDQVAKVEDLLEETYTENLYKAEPLKYGADQTMAIVCSSGTTGLPKAVSVSNARLNLDRPFSNGSSVMFSFATPDWGTGILQVASILLAGGTRVITTKPFTPEYLLEIVVKYKVSFLGASPAQVSQASLCAQCTKQTMASILLIFMTGGHCSVATTERINAVLTNGFLQNTYASSEFGGISTNFLSSKPESVGQLLPNAELKIVDVQRKTPLGRNQVGEIWVRRPFKWRGYIGNKKATREIMDADNWICTGDVGYMDAEDYLYLLDRSKDIMKYCSFHYSPHEIEETITSLPDVVDVCVFGVFDEKFGDLAAAAVVKRPHSSLTERNVVRYVAEKQTVKHKQLNYGAFFVEAIVRNTNGKLMRQQNKELCLKMEKQRATKSKI